MAKSIDISVSDILNCVPTDKDILTVGVAVSGGRDSVALLHCLKTLENNQSKDGAFDRNGNPQNVKLKVVAVNVEHGIRGASSLNDSLFVKKLCNEWGIHLYPFGVDAPEFAKANGYTLEQAGRILRYEIFDKLITIGKCDCIALAHHLDDQAETVLMRILRGTGIRGLCGMRKTSGKYIRPFLDYSREDINAYIDEHCLRFVEDETNEDISYTRNFLRKEIAVLKQRYPQLNESIKRLADSAAEADEFIEANVSEIDVKDGEVYVKVSDCANKLIAKRLILKAANALGVRQDIEDKHYALVLDLLDAENGKYLMLTHGLCVHKENEYLVFNINSGRSAISECAFAAGEYPFIGTGVSVRQVSLSDVAFGEKDVLFADADKIPQGAVIRGRREGDHIHKFGGGTKSLGDYLTDKKVPLRMREGLIVAADGSRVLAVFGVDISADVKIDGDTKRAYALSLLK